jgi:heat shock protein HslJ
LLKINYLNGDSSLADASSERHIKGNFCALGFVYRVIQQEEKKRRTDMKRDPIRFVVLYLIVTLFLIACGASGLFGGGGDDRAELEGVTWKLTAMGAQGNPQPVVDAGRVTLAFDFGEGRVQGNGGCNSYSAEFEVNGSKITIGPAMSTLMACFPQEVMDQETAYHQTLAKAERFEVGGGRLSIFTSDGQVLVFVP